MPETSVIHSTFVIERSYPHSPERVFAAFADPALKARWFAPEGVDNAEYFKMDFRVGGEERLVFRVGSGAPVTGVLTNQGVIQDIVPNQRVVAAYTMSLNDKRFSSSLITIELLATGAGTDLICTHQGAFFEGGDGPEMRRKGWESLFDRLATVLGAS
jgi:uncharacterized protein YndB with AHSA1/START domain